MALYIVCFDLAASLEDQYKQIQMWLQYLYSILCNHSNTVSQESTWKVIIVGTRADLAQSTQFEYIDTTTVFQVCI